MLKKITSVLFLFNLFSESAFSEAVTIDLLNVSKLPIHAEELSRSKANVIAFIGGKGLMNRKGRSKNYLVKQKSILINGNLNFYLFPNWSKSEKATYQLRASDKRASRILNLLEAIRNRNSLPIYLIGFSRGSVDVASFAKRYPKMIRGIVIMSGVYTNNSKKAKSYSMEKIIGMELGLTVLVVHHKKDKCKVTPFRYAKRFIATLNASKKKFLFYKGGSPTGKSCGPLHYHGFENIEEKVANDITNWITTDLIK